MPSHTVEKGECMTSISRQYGFADYHTVYDHPQNKGLKDKRKNPNMLFPGDEVFIPEHEPKEVQIARRITAPESESGVCVPQ